MGVFYDKESVDKKFNTLLNEYEFEEGESKDTYIINNEYSEIPLISQEVGVYYSFLEDSSAESIGHSNENIYVTIEFLEEELLNKNLGFKFNEDLKKEISFDSTDQLSNFSEDLLNVQLWTKSYTGLSFLYPTLDRENLKEIGKIPIRNLFVNLDLILNAFESEDTVFSAIKNILDRITSDSYGVMKLILKERSDNRLTIVDLNSPLVNVPKNEKKDESTEEGEDENATSSDDTGVDKNIVEATKTFYNFDDLFVFNPYSPNSIVSNMDLSLEMPSNTMASIIAINATSIDKQIYPGSPGVRLGMGLKDLHVQVDDNVSGSDGKSYYEWLPSPSSDTTNKINDSQLASKISSLYIPEGTIIDSDTPEYKSALSSYEQFFEGENKSDATSELGKLIDDLNEAYAGSIEYYLGERGGGVELGSGQKSDNISKKEDVKIISANSIAEFFQLKLSNNSIENMKTNKSPFILPYSLNLSFYGISGIFPGNVFRVNYLPEVYVDKIVFITENVVHTITSDKWTTSIGSYSMYRNDKMFDTVKILVPVITWNPKLLKKAGYSDDQIKEVIKNPEVSWWEEIPEGLQEHLNEEGRYLIDEKLESNSDQGNVVYEVQAQVSTETAEQTTFTSTAPGELSACNDGNCGCADPSAINYVTAILKDCSGIGIPEQLTTDNASGVDFSCCSYVQCGDWLGINWHGCLSFTTNECYHYLHHTYADNSVYGMDCFKDTDYNPTAVCDYPNYTDEFYSLRFCQNVCGLCGDGIINICDETECVGDLNIEPLDGFPNTIYERYGLAGTQGICIYTDGVCMPNFNVCRPDYTDQPWDEIYEDWSDANDVFWTDGYSYDESNILHYMWHQYEGVAGDNWESFPNKLPYDLQCEYIMDTSYYEDNTGMD